MSYRPKLRNGQNVPLIWPLACVRALNVICWPLDSNASKRAKILDRCYLVLFIIIFIQHIDAQTRFIIENYHNLDKLLSALPTFLALSEITIRSLYVGLSKQQRMIFIQKFYADVYVEKSKNPELYQSIQRKMRPTFAYSITYLTLVFTYVFIPLKSLITQQRDLLTDMIYRYDIQPLGMYLPTVLASSWLLVMSVTTLLGEANIMSEIMMHLHGQYLALDKDLQLNCSELLEQIDSESISRKFSAKLKIIIQRNVELKQFAAEFQNFFSLQIFITYSFAAMVLCAVVFKIYINPSESVPFIIWIASKILGMITFGEVGSTLIATSNKVSTIYFNSNWELIVSSSTSTKENVELMKLLITAMETNHKPFILTGLKIFSVSLTSVLKILQGAGSYFTCLISLR